MKDIIGTSRTKRNADRKNGQNLLDARPSGRGPGQRLKRQARTDDAKRVMEVLPKRFGKYGLTIHPDKTRLVPFQQPVARRSASGQLNGPGPILKDRARFIRRRQVRCSERPETESGPKGIHGRLATAPPQAPPLPEMVHCVERKNAVRCACGGRAAAGGASRERPGP